MGKRKADFVDLAASSEDDGDTAGPSRRGQGPGGGPSGSARVVLPPAGVGARPPQRKAKAKGKPKQEKRVDAAGNTVRFASKPSIQVQERIDRALSRGAGAAHRMYLLDRRMLSPVGSGEGAAEEFSVQGATGNVYTVTICRQPQCTCPDFLKRGSCCKHILFCQLRALGLAREDPLVWQRAYLSTEVDEILGGLRSRPGAAQDALASQEAQDRYRWLSASQAGPSGRDGGSGGGQRPIEGDCPICFEALSSSEAVSFCHTCGNNLHKSCLGHWVDSKRQGGQAVTCPFCRAPWQDEDDGGGDQGKKQYINLGGPTPSLDQLYGNRSVWVRANMGEIARDDAARMWSALGSE